MSKSRLYGKTGSQVLSSFHSSSSFINFQDDFVINDPRVPEIADTLETGLELILDHNFVKNVWTSDKQRETLQELFVGYQIILVPIHEEREDYQEF